MKIIIKELRIQKGWSQKEVAERLEISVSYLRKIESNKVMPSIGLAKSMSSLFGLKKIDDIFRDNEQKK